MTEASPPVVTIGIPTHNRAATLRRSIESALRQDYPAIEVIVSDNASTDGTLDVCREFGGPDGRVTWITQSVNRGATANFAQVLQAASGEFFMWLGDDDWIDDSYVSRCVSHLAAEPDLALVSGAPRYYRNGTPAYAGKAFDLPDDSWARRVARYYATVEDNGMFYGVMRTAQVRQVGVSNALGGDWHVVANILSMGKSRMSPAVALHRELGGATTSYRQIVAALGLPAVQGAFPMTTVALGAARNIVFDGPAYRRRALPARILLAGAVFVIVVVRPLRGRLGRARHALKRGALRILHAGAPRRPPGPAAP